MDEKGVGPLSFWLKFSLMWYLKPQKCFNLLIATCFNMSRLKLAYIDSLSQKRVWWNAYHSYSQNFAIMCCTVQPRLSGLHLSGPWIIQTSSRPANTLLCMRRRHSWWYLWVWLQVEQIIRRAEFLEEVWYADFIFHLHSDPIRAIVVAGVQ